MGRNVLILSATLLLPFLGGGLIGYNIGHAHAPGNVPAEQAAALFSKAVPVAHGSAGVDSAEGRVEDSRRNAITRTVAAVSPAVVGINVIEMRTYRRWNPWGDDPFFRQFFGDQTYVEKIPSLGSGFIISPDGYILTNDHVAGNAKEITVTMTSGDKYKADVIGTDLVSDIALLKIEGKNLPYVRLGNSEDVIIGEWSIAFGNPFGLFDISDKPTVTVGVVSAVNMNLRGQEGRVYRGMIQTDAAINAGNSGGPLVNSLGEVIGVNAVIYTPNQGSIGLGFAIPINRVKGIVAELRKSGKIEREFWTGLEIQVVDQRIARYFGLEKAEGVIVSDVRRGSPADRGGFAVGDIILSVDGERITDDQTMVSLINDHKVGDRLAVRVMREKKMLSLNLQLEKRPAQGDR
jgi:serine protease Do